MPQCPPGKIINPKTNRCVNIDGPIGKTLLKQTPLNPTCPPGEVPKVICVKAQKPSPKKPSPKKTSPKKTSPSLEQKLFNALLEVRLQHPKYRIGKNFSGFAYGFDSDPYALRFHFDEEEKLHKISISYDLDEVYKQSITPVVLSNITTLPPLDNEIKVCVESIRKNVFKSGFEIVTPIRPYLLYDNDYDKFKKLYPSTFDVFGLNNKSNIHLYKKRT